MKKSTNNKTKHHTSHPVGRIAARSLALNYLPADQIPKQYRRVAGKGRFPSFYPDLNISLVAQKLECSQGYISSILRGNKEGSPEFVAKLAGLLKLDVKDLEKLRRKVAAKLADKPNNRKAA